MDEEGPWKLLAWLDQIQPLTPVGESIIPTFSYHLLLDHIRNSGQDLRTAVLDIISQAIELEQEHILSAVENLADRTGESLSNQIEERTDSLDTFFDTSDDLEDGERRRPQEMVEEISSLAHFPIKLNNDQMRLLNDDPRQVQEDIEEQIEGFLTNITTTRLVGAVENRLGNPLNLEKQQLLGLNWDEIEELVMAEMRSSLQKKTQSLIGENGQILQEIDDFLQRKELSGDSSIILMLNTLSQGRKKTFDSRTHRQVQQVFARFSYIYLAAKMVADMEPSQIEDAVLTHLESARDAIRKAWGEAEWTRMVQNLEVPKLLDLPQVASVIRSTNGNIISSERYGTEINLN